ncbi:threonine-phosphate decarboxylase CobD [Microbaculum marinum]|uniref:threonine-phosphate decarboxylase n=1 Tax=Microbaculum marinum TaxID=1764581 RepID=A0AAW9RPT0_9HYPH
MASTFDGVPAGGDGSIAHGGRLAEARRLFPDAPQPFLDLSTGINPVPYPVPPLAPQAWSRLPEPDDLRRLEAAAAAAWGTEAGHVVAAPGTQVLISMLPRVVRLASVAVVGPTYAEHAAAWASAGAGVVAIGSPHEGHPCAGVVLCNPNNPDGRRHAPGDLAAIAEDRARHGGLLVVDEAFADLEDGPLSLIPDLPGEGVVVLRSFGKTYGLAGLRLGFAVAGPRLAAAIREALGPWAVSGPAIEIGRAALSDDAWLAVTRARLTADALRMDDLLAGAGLEVVGGTRLFRLARHRDALALFDRLGRAGIFVRRFADHPNWLRVGLPAGERDWARLEAALR